MNWHVQGHNLQKKRFQFSNFLWPKLPIFSKKSYFLPLNGRNNCHNSDQSCPWWWRKLTNKKICCGIKIDNCGIKSVRQWIGLRRLYTSFTHFTEVIRRRNHQKSPKIKIHKKSPAMTTNQLTCTTNMSVVSNFLHRLWGLQRRKVLKFILHCNWKILISHGNNSASEFLLL